MAVKSGAASFPAAVVLVSVETGWSNPAMRSVTRCRPDSDRSDRAIILAVPPHEVRHAGTGARFGMRSKAAAGCESKLSGHPTFHCVSFFCPEIFLPTIEGRLVLCQYFVSGCDGSSCPSK